MKTSKFLVFLFTLCFPFQVNSSGLDTLFESTSDVDGDNSSVTQEIPEEVVSSIDYTLATNDSEYRNSWITVDISNANYPLHQKFAKSVVLAHAICDSDASNTAAFGFSLHKADGGIVTIDFPFVLSSGELRSLKPQEPVLKTVTSLFTDPISIHPPKNRLVKFIEFLQTNGLNFYKLGEAKTALLNQTVSPRTTDNLRLDDEADIFIGYVKHCEQCFIFTLINDSSLLLREVVDGLNLQSVANGDYLSFDILTYNDMCQRCFGGCQVFQRLLAAKLQGLVPGVNIPVRIHVSSIRPFAIQIGKGLSFGYTRGETDPANYTEFSVPPSNHGNEDGEIIQFVNPWMNQEIAELEAKQAIRAIHHSIVGTTIPFWEPISRVVSLKLNNIKPSDCNKAVSQFSAAIRQMTSENRANIAAEIQVIKPEIEESKRLVQGEIDKRNTELVQLQKSLDMLNL